MRNNSLLLLLFVYCSASLAQFGPPPLSPLAKKIQSAMDSDIRTAAEKSRDGNRSPIATLEFMRLEDDMTVVELVPQEGWYTKILGPVLSERGKLYVAPIGRKPVDALSEGYEGLSDVKTLPFIGELSLVTNTGIPMGFFEISDFSIPINGVDLILTFRNYHNFTKESRYTINKAVFQALKSGGLYGVVDHTRRHNEPTTTENWRRMDPVLIIQEVQDAGFELIDFSDLHYRPDDELRYEVGRYTVTGNSDRFALLFKKPTIVVRESGR